MASLPFPAMPYKTAGHDVVAERQPGIERRGHRQERVPHAEDRVVRERRGARRAGQHDPAVDVEEQVVGDRKVHALHAGDAWPVVQSEHAHAESGGVLDDVVFERDIAHGRPGRGPVLIADREQHRMARLRVHPAVFEDVVEDSDVTGVLELEQVLHRAPVRCLPRGRLEEVIAADCEVGRNQVRQGRILAAGHEVLAARLEVVVLDHQRARPVEDGHRLAVAADLPEPADVGIQLPARPRRSVRAPCDRRPQDRHGRTHDRRRCRTAFALPASCRAGRSAPAWRKASWRFRRTRGQSGCNGWRRLRPSESASFPPAPGASP